MGERPLDESSIAATGADPGTRKAVHEARGANTNHEAPAERYPLSGGSRFRGSGHNVDIYAFGTDEGPLVAEVKSCRSGAGFVTLEKWLGEYDCLFLRHNSAEPMVLLRWRVWAALLARVRR